MFRKKGILRATAIFLLLNTINFTFAPTIAWALTAGPTAPEATSFEPVDTTDMVNLITGDLTYNIPLLEVPGPSGGYPLSLSYHAGIMPNEEASWVGLGWTLNPGAITRSVSGFADDHENALITNRFRWDGGEKYTAEIGASIGISGTAALSAGISVGHDTYQGFGIGSFVGFSVGLGEEGEGPFSASGGFGVSPWGQPYASAGISIGMSDGEDGAGSLGASLSVSTNFESVSVGAGAGVSVRKGSKKDGKGEEIKTGLQPGSVSLLGVSIGTNSKSGFSINASGIASVHNSRQGKISTYSEGFTLPVPFVHLSYKYQRYWIDETDEVSSNGVLHYPTYGTNITNDFFDQNDFDSYALLDPTEEGGIVDNPDPDKVLGGSFPNYDAYYVNAQGLTGNIRPYYYQSYISRRNKFNIDTDDKRTDEVYHVQLGKNSKKAKFRFVKDFSNRLEYDPSGLSFNTVGGELDPEYMYDDDSLKVGKENDFVYEDNYLAGSRHIEYFTNAEIISGTAKSKGFRDTSAAGFERDDNNQIGGFMITNESGVTYHYALPVYARGEYAYSEKIDVKDVKSFNEIKRDTKYAYTWYLTGVTGPDYVDRSSDSDSSSDGKLNKADWGYWVAFDYGLWTENYIWRNPTSGFNEDLDSEFQNYAGGRKELYYLNTVKTKTHTAVFVKEIRKDGKGVINIKDGGFEPNGFDNPLSTLALKSIYLFKNDIFSWNLPANSSVYDHRNSPTWIFHLGNNVIDIHDITDDIKEDFQSKALRTIRFDHDYSLCDKTDNSFVSAIDVLNTAESANPAKSGKLTLNALRFLGKGGVDLIPAMNFNYDKNPDYDKEAYDLWGMYKSDYVDTGDDNIDRMVSPISAAQVDAWSLTEIETNLGATVKIEYESDTYGEAVLQNNYALIIDNVIPTDLPNSNEFTISFKNNPDLTKLTGVLHRIGLVDSYAYYLFGGITASAGSFELKVKSVTPNTITFEDEDYAASLRLIKTVWGMAIFSGGNVSLNNINKCGGGIRVKSIQTIDHLTTRVNKTLYGYEGLHGFSSGVTAYEPSGLDRYDFNVAEGGAEGEKNFKKVLYSKFSNLLATSREAPAPGVMYEYITVKESVTQNGIEKFLPNHSTFNFTVFDESMVGFVDMEPKEQSGFIGSYQNKSFTKKEIRKLALKDYTASIGSLKSITLYDSDNKAVSKTINHYLQDQVTADMITDNDPNIEDNLEAKMDIYEPLLESKFFSQGLVEETFVDARIVNVKDFDANYNAPDEFTLKGIVTKREQFPSIQTGQTNINYKTGITTTSETLAFDFYSGAVTKTLSSDGYGNYYVSESTPAYRVPEYAGNETTAGMGLKVMNPNNKHMLTQVASTKAYKVASATDHSPVGLLSAGVQTWSNEVDVMTENTNTIKQPKIWRKHKSYAFIGDKDNLQADGTYNYGQYTDFTWWSEATGEPAESTRWQKQSELTLYDVYSHALEATDINGNYAATKMGLDQTKIKATAANANYDEFAYAGMEDVPGGLGEIPAPYIHIGGSVYIPNESTVSKVKTHTGTNSLQLTAGDVGFIFTSKGVNKTSRISVWSTSPNVDIKYVVGDEDHVGDEDITTKDVYIAEKLPVKQAGDWYLIRANVSPLNENNYSSTSVTFYCEAKENLNLDDFRVHPIDAAMTSYVYNEWDELSHVLDANNLFTEYKYDGMGRLESTYKETFQYGVKKISEVKYNYGRDKKLLAEFTHSGNQLVNKNLLFNAVVNSATLGTTTYTWDFGDGTNVQTGLNVNHTYSATGVYTVKLSVSNTDYSTVSKTEVMVINNPLTLVNVCANGYIGYDYCGEVMPISGTCTLGTPDKEKVTFNVTVGKLSSGCSPYHYQWQKKPNSSWVNFGGDSDVATEFFTSEGSTGIRCKVTDACGANVTSNTVTIARFKSVAGCTVVAE